LSLESFWVLTLRRIRIQLFTLMWIRIQLPKIPHCLRQFHLLTNFCKLFHGVACVVAVLHAVIKEADSSVLGAADHTSTPRLSKVFAISSGMRSYSTFNQCCGSGSG
jgi:hypothetical protein